MFRRKRRLVYYIPVLVVLPFAILSQVIAPKQVEGQQTVYIDPVPYSSNLSGNEVQNIMNTYPSGTLFILRAGNYYNQKISPRNGDTIQGETNSNGDPITYLNGSMPISGFTSDSGYWSTSVTFDRRKSDSKTYCFDDDTSNTSIYGTDVLGECNNFNDVYIDSTPLEEVGSLAELGVGKFYVNSNSFGQGTYKIYVGSNPIGKTVELGITDKALGSTATNVTVKNLVIQKYANSNSVGGIQIDGDFWLIDNITSTLNHSVGIRAYSNSTIVNSKFNYNGHAGYLNKYYGATSPTRNTNLLFENNELGHNNYAKFHPGWSGTGGKWAHDKNVIIRGNYVHDNYGPGIWLDIKNAGFLIEDNLVINNSGAGIENEISRDLQNPSGTGAKYETIIRNNTVINNDIGILIANSEKTEIYGNVIRSQTYVNTSVQRYDRGEWKDAVYGNYVHNNTFILDTEFTLNRNYTVLSDGDAYYEHPDANLFDYNTYYVVDGNKCITDQSDTKGGVFIYGQTSSLKWSQLRAGTFTKNNVTYNRTPQEVNGSLFCGINPPNTCGDGICGSGETMLNCPSECGPNAQVQETVPEHDITNNYIVIQAEDYNLGGQGVGYNDLSTGNNGGEYRNDDVDIKAIGGGGYAIGWQQTNEWMKYSFDVLMPGTYKIYAKVAAVDDNRSIQLKFNNQNIFDATIPNTGDYASLTEVEVGTVELAAGENLLQTTVTQQYYDLDYIRLVQIETQLGCLGDYDSNGLVNSSDFTVFKNNYKKQNIDCGLDIVNSDCILNVADLNEFSKVYDQPNACN